MSERNLVFGKCRIKIPIFLIITVRVLNQYLLASGWEIKITKFYSYLFIYYTYDLFNGSLIHHPHRKLNEMSQ